MILLILWGGTGLGLMVTGMIGTGIAWDAAVQPDASLARGAALSLVMILTASLAVFGFVLLLAAVATFAMEVTL